MSLTPLDMPTVISRLRRNWPEAIIDGDMRSDGFWIRAVSKSGNWAWERFAIPGVGSAQQFAEVALTEFHGAH